MPPPGTLLNQTRLNMLEFMKFCLKIFPYFLKMTCFILIIQRCTEEVAPLFASFILCEAICEFQDQRKGLTVVLLDDEKAFDRVSHDGLFRKLAALQIPMECWMVLRDWYRDLNNTVKWNGTLSHTFPIHQGTLQGSVISPHPSPTHRGHHRNCVLCRPDIKDKNSLEFDICERQLAVKGSKSRSWLIYI